ncbi:cystathionine beta-lyase [Athelia psychrophila]|uniref:Cystathionine beta-lyase n=1 Tax=Athelia psychrophila TaxID=1759441 RepID=A0A167VGY1_9AGAM|nr:cystathionine beta-lyase [Fibularhizoctonia sp. CBS 109695]
MTSNPLSPLAKNDAAKGPSSPSRHWRTALIQSQPQVPENFRSLVPAVHRGSTVTFNTVAEAVDDWHVETSGYTYGVYGTPNTLEFAKRISEIEGARHTFLVPGGQAAIALIYFSFCKAGSHVLAPKNIYGPSGELADDLLAGLNIEVEYYDPMIGSGISSLIRPNTSLIWCETPGSVTFEIPDIPAIVFAARERGVLVALDNTYAAGVLFDAFGHGVDISMQALTKYVGGASDLLMGTVSVKSEQSYERVGSVHRLLGLAISPEDCALAHRGLQTLGVRLAHFERSAITVAKWLKARQEISLVLHPAFEDCPGHEIWKRDFTGSTGVFSIVFAEDWDAERVAKFVEALQTFKIGMSWGGVHSLVMVYSTMTRHGHGHRLIRLNVGLEEAEDLVHDLEQALKCAATVTA